MAPAASAYETPNIRNVVLFGHGGAGKTTLVDAMCYVAGGTNRKGDVQKGNALTDFTPEETGHGISINLAVAHAEWNETRVNLIDTPGYLDFLGEVVAGMRAADAGLCVVDAISGVEVGTEKTWAAADDAGLPRAVFVSMMDRGQRQLPPHRRPDPRGADAERAAGAGAGRVGRGLPRHRRSPRDEDAHAQGGRPRGRRRGRSRRRRRR